MSSRIIWSMLALALAVAPACSSKEAGIRAQQEEAEAEAKRLAKEQPSVPKQRAPVAGSRKLDCNQLIDMTAFREALGEKEPMAMRDVSKTNAEANASCSLLRGGRTPSMKEQEAIIKRQGKLGVIAGDELCNITVSCNTVEREESFMERCKELKMEPDESAGFTACSKLVPHGSIDVKAFRFLDPETKCVIEVRGGPSVKDSDFVGKCAKTARDLIGPEQISETPPSAVEPEITDTVDPAPAQQ